MRFRFIPHDSPLATAVFAFKAGSLSDPPGQEGVSHYLEHVLLDASRGYPSEAAVSDAFARVGARTNGGTGFESVCYYGTCRASRLAEMLAVHCDLVSSPLLREEDVERERKIVMSELRDGRDDAMEVFWAAALEGALGWAPVIGREGTVSAVTAGQIREHHARHHGTSTLMVTVCGPASAEEAVRRGIAGLGPASPPPPREPAVDLHAAAIVRPEFKQACLALLAPGAPGLASPFRENLVASVASNCVGGNDFSLLFRRLRGELGLTYGVGASAVRWRGGGATCVSSQFDPSLVGRVRSEIDGVIRRVVDGGVPEDTVAFAKDAMLTSAAAGCETSAGLARWFESYHLSGAPGVPETYGEYEGLLGGVSPAEVGGYASRVFAPLLDPDASKVVVMTPS